MKHLTQTNAKPLRKNESYNPEAAKRELLKLMRTAEWALLSAEQAMERMQVIKTKYNVA